MRCRVGQGTARLLPPQRNKIFDRILSKVAFFTRSADIGAPPGSRDVAIGMYLLRRSCGRQADESRAMVHVLQVR